MIYGYLQWSLLPHTRAALSTVGSSPDKFRSITLRSVLRHRHQLCPAAWCGRRGVWLCTEQPNSCPSAAAAGICTGGHFIRRDASTSCAVQVPREAKLNCTPFQTSWVNIQLISWALCYYFTTVATVLWERWFPLVQTRKRPQKLTELPARALRTCRVLELCLEMHNWNMWARL